MSARIDRLLTAARDALRHARRLDSADRRRGLLAMAEALEAEQAAILEANAADLAAADGLDPALKDRLRLSPERVSALVTAVREVADMPDPLAEERNLGAGAQGIEVFKRRIPLGVLAVVYEARPNVTAECAALAVASGNAIVLRGGKEACHSNAAIGRAVEAGLAKAGLPAGLVAVIADSSREDVKALLGAVGRVDLVIPRGGAGLMRMVDEHAKVPVIRHGQGICHVFVDAAADLDMAAQIAFNAKVHRPSVCNAMETLLVHADVVAPLLGALGPKLSEAGVELHADPAARAALESAGVASIPATSEDWDTEFQSLTLAIRTVQDLDAAIDHVAVHGSSHTASIVTESAEQAERFLNEVDTSCVLWNASTRFNDGGQLGFGAEIGISTTRMHAFGPMSVRELTAEKLVVRGTGQVRA